jgi:hypothetical protein
MHAVEKWSMNDDECPQISRLFDFCLSTYLTWWSMKVLTRFRLTTHSSLLWQILYVWLGSEIGEKKKFRKFVTQICALKIEWMCGNKEWKITDMMVYCFRLWNYENYLNKFRITSKYLLKDVFQVKFNFNVF